jgi:DNA-binding response OmpR family regulator
MRALVVAFERSVRKQVALLVEDLGFQSVVCKHGGEAMELFENGEVFHLMVSQIMLPSKDGWELAKWREDREAGASILLTAQWSPDLERERFFPVRISPLPVDTVHLSNEVRQAMLKVNV